MGRHKIYVTEEERKAHKLQYEQEYHQKKLEKLGRDNIEHPCKHKRYYQEGVRVDIGTLDRTQLDTAYVDMMVTTSYTNDEGIINQFKRETRKTFNDWLYNQEMWDRKHRICVLEYAAIRKSYVGMQKSFTLQFHVRRDKITPWKDTYTNLMELVNSVIDTIKKTCLETGLELRSWNSRKSSDITASDATEPQAGSGLLVEV